MEEAVRKENDSGNGSGYSTKGRLPLPVEDDVQDQPKHHDTNEYQTHEPKRKRKKPSLWQRFKKANAVSQINVVLTIIIAASTLITGLINGITAYVAYRSAMAAEISVVQSRQNNIDAIAAQRDIAADSLRASQENFRESLRASDESLRKTLAEMKTQSDASTALATEARRQADLARDAMLLDQRPWVGFAGAETIAGTQSSDGKTFSFKSVLISIRNSGKTPAINVSAVTLQTSLDWKEKIGDYDTFTAESERRRDEALSKFQEEQIRRNPKMADQIRAWDKEMKEREQKYTSELFPAGQVIAPGLVLTQGTPSFSYGIRDDEHMTRLVVYILGKITYNDVFQNTPKHTTKFCLMRKGGTQFVPCPTGNYMD